MRNIRNLHNLMKIAKTKKQQYLIARLNLLQLSLPLLEKYFE